MKAKIIRAVGGTTVTRDSLGDYRVTIDDEYASWASLGHVSFQNGSIEEAGINGLEVEHLLAICINRLEVTRSDAPEVAATVEAVSLMRGALEALDEYASKCGKNDDDHCNIGPDHQYTGETMTAATPEASDGDCDPAHPQTSTGQIQRLEHERMKLDARLTAHAEREKRLEIRLSEVRARAADAERKLDRSERDGTRLQHKLDRAEDHIAALESSLRAYKDGTAEDDQVLRRQLEEAREHIKKILEIKNDYLHRLEALEGRFNKLAAMYAEARLELEAAKAS